MDNDLTIHQAVEYYAEQAPYHIAIIDGERSYTYQEINQQANQLAHYLRQYRLHTDTIIAVSLEKSPQLIIVLLAILKAGCAYLTLDPNQPNHRLQYILNDAQVPILLTHTQYADKFTAVYSGRLIYIDAISQTLNSQPFCNPNTIVGSEALAYVIYTSGSTGMPKGVLVEHKSVVNYSKWFNDYSQCQAQDCIDFSSNIIFDMAVTVTLTALTMGLKIVICSDQIKKDVRQYLQYLNKYKINFIKLTPSYFKILIQEASHHTITLQALKAIILGGEILQAKDCSAWLAMYPTHTLFNEYGPTETTVAITSYKVTKENINSVANIVPIGKPIDNIHCELVHEGKQIISHGEIGELYVSGICVARGYLNQQQLTDNKFIHDSFQNGISERFYKTGDLCRYLPDGNIEYLERIDDQVKIRGYRIELGEIEQCLASHPFIKENKVIVNEKENGDKQLIAYYILDNDNHELSHQELRHYMQRKLVDYMVPSVFIKIKTFPLNENGKLDKKMLPLSSIDEEEIPHTDLEKKLVQIWKKVFQVSKISANSHFLELGGDSLIAAKMIMEIEMTLGKKINLEEIYKFPTISEQAIILDFAENIVHEDISQNIPLNTKNIPLSDFQFIFWMSNLFEPKIKKINIVSRKRLLGKINSNILNAAFNYVLQTHEILTYQIKKWFPLQYVKQKNTPRILETDLSFYSEIEIEEKLSYSLNELINAKWHINSPLIKIKLFHLNNDKSEIQICASHLCFDDASIKIFFNELSQSYLYFKHRLKLPKVKHKMQYGNYVFYEKNHLNQNLKRDISFWKDYLNNTSLVVLPKTEIIHDMSGQIYSTYVELPTNLIDHIQHTAKINLISSTEYLCAAISMSLKKMAGHLNQNNVYMNIIHSSRDNDDLDKMIGCFLRLDPITVDLTSELNIVALAKEVQQSRMVTDPHQACSGMVKLACLNKNQNNALDFIANIGSKIYCNLFRHLKLHPEMLMMYPQLSSLRSQQIKNDQFVVNINLLNNFASSTANQKLFGCEFEKVQPYKYNLSTVNNVLDICFLKNENLDKSYIVISGNLNPSFRTQLGHAIIDACEMNID